MAMALEMNKQFGAKIETSPGVKETLSAANYGLYLSDISGSTSPETIKMKAFRGTLSAAPSRIGKAPASVAVSGELKNSGVANTKPACDALLRAAGYKALAVKSTAITAVTGSIVRGKTLLTGGSSGTKAVAIKVNGGTLYHAIISGTGFTTSETITGTGFTATAGATSGTAAGWAYVPRTVSDTAETITCVLNDSGILKPIYGAVSTFNLELGVDSYPTVSFDVQGITDTSLWGTAASQVTGIAYEEHMPSVVQAANLTINGTVTPITQSVSLSSGSTLAMITDLNSATWYRYGMVTAREPSGTLNVNSIDPATYNAYSAFFAGSTATLAYQTNSAAGIGVEVILPAIQYTGVSEGATNGLMTTALNFSASGFDTELTLWFL